MTLTAKESATLAGSLVAGGVPTVMNAVGADDLTLSLSNAIFEGEKDRARLFAAVGFVVFAGILGGAAVIGPLNGTEGVVALGGGVASLMLAVSVLLEEV